MVGNGIATAGQDDDWAEVREAGNRMINSYIGSCLQLISPPACSLPRDAKVIALGRDRGDAENRGRIVGIGASERFFNVTSSVAVGVHGEGLAARREL